MRPRRIGDIEFACLSWEEFIGDLQAQLEEARRTILRRDDQIAALGTGAPAAQNVEVASFQEQEQGLEVNVEKLEGQIAALRKEVGTFRDAATFRVPTLDPEALT